MLASWPWWSQQTTFLCHSHPGTSTYGWNKKSMKKVWNGCFVKTCIMVHHFSPVLYHITWGQDTGHANCMHLQQADNLIGHQQGAIVLFIYWGWQHAFISTARCLRVSKTERYGLSRFCFEMTRQATKTRWRRAVNLSRWTTQKSPTLQNNDVWRQTLSFKSFSKNFWTEQWRAFCLKW
jgi:hypothetical protein